MRGIAERKPKGRARYEQIAESLIEEIRSGTLAAGERIPSEMQLQERFAVSRVTMRQALGILEFQGLIQRFRKRGSFVLDKPAGGRGAGKREGLKVIQFLHSGFDKAHAHPFSRGEVEAVERYYAMKGAAVAWSAINFNAFLDGQLPPAVEQGACSGILLDGVLTPLHVEMVRRLEKPFVVLGGHELGDLEGKVNHVTVDFRTWARDVRTVAERLRSRHLVILDNALDNSTQRLLARELSLQLAETRMPPPSLIPLQAAMQPGFFEMLDRIAPRCAVMISSLELPGVLMTLMSGDPDWKRHPFIAFGPPFPAEGPHLTAAAWIKLFPEELAVKGCEVLDRHMADPLAGVERVELVPRLEIPGEMLP